MVCTGNSQAQSLKKSRKKQRNSFSPLFNSIEPNQNVDLFQKSTFCSFFNTEAYGSVFNAAGSSFSIEQRHSNDLQDDKCNKMAFSTPTKDELMVKMVEVEVGSQIFHLVHTVQTKLVALDFDQTLLSIHTNGKWNRKASDLAQFVRPVFKALIPRLLRKGLLLAIVTFSAQFALIERLLNIAFKETVIGKNVFICGGENPILRSKPFSDNRTFGTQLSVKMFFPPYQQNLSSQLKPNFSGSGKCKHIELVLQELLRKRVKVDQEEILFIDDDICNIHACEKRTPNVKSILFQCTNSEVESENLFLEDIIRLQ